MIKIRKMPHIAKKSECELMINLLHLQQFGIMLQMQQNRIKCCINKLMLQIQQIVANP